MIEWFIRNFNYIANFCSILGLMVSLFVLYNLKGIRRNFQFKARTPEIINELTDFSKELNSYTDNVDACKNEIIILSKKLEYTLRSLRKKANKELVKNIDQIISRISKLKRGGPLVKIFSKSSNWSFKDETWELYSDIQGILQGLKEVVKDSHWSGQ